LLDVFVGVKQESNSTTLMLVVVVTLFLLVEFPLGVNMSIMIIENTAGKALVPEDTRALVDLFLNLVILLSYPLNFFIYCAMSQRFRQEFCRTVACWVAWRPHDFSLQVTTEPLGTGAPPLNGCGDWRSPAPPVRRDNSAVYIPLTGIVVRRDSDDAPGLIADDNGNDDDVAEVHL